LARLGIRHIRPESADEVKANFDRSQRQATLARIVNGEDLGQERRHSASLS